MNDAMPAFGTERNAAIAKLLGWAKVRGRMYCKSFESRPYAQMPDYCGNDADCFGLMVKLQTLPFIWGVTLFVVDGKACIKIGTDLLKYPDGWTYDACEQSASADADGWRDAITQAAWLALTAAAKKTE